MPVGSLLRKEWYKCNNCGWLPSSVGGVVERMPQNDLGLTWHEACAWWCEQEPECVSAWHRISGNHCSLYNFTLPFAANNHPTSHIYVKPTLTPTANPSDIPSGSPTSSTSMDGLVRGWPMPVGSLLRKEWYKCIIVVGYRALWVVLSRGYRRTTLDLLGTRLAPGGVNKNQSVYLLGIGYLAIIVPFTTSHSLLLQTTTPPVTFMSSLCRIPSLHPFLFLHQVNLKHMISSVLHTIAVRRIAESFLAVTMVMKIFRFRNALRRIAT